MQSQTNEGQDVRSQAEQTASTVVEQARQVAQTNVNSQKERAAETLGTVAQTLRDSGSSMQDQQPQIASLANQAAERVEGLSTYIREHDVRDFVGEAESFARREPLMFLGGAFAVGFLAARFLKATSPNRYGGDYNATSGRYGDVSASGGYGSTGYGSAGHRSMGYGGSNGGGSLDQGTLYPRTAGYGESGYVGSTAGASAGTGLESGYAGYGDAGSTRETEYAGAAYTSGEGGQDAESLAGSGGISDEAGTTDALAADTHTWDRPETDR